MNKTEATEILDTLKAMFPGWRIWARGLPDPDATIRVWVQSLETASADAVHCVLSGFMNGTRKPPTDFQYESLVFGLVAAAREIETAEATRAANAESVARWKQEAAAAELARAESKGGRMQSAYLQAKQIIDQLIAETGRPLSQWGDAEHEVYKRRLAAIVSKFETKELGNGRKGKNEIGIGRIGSRTPPQSASQRELPRDHDFSGDESGPDGNGTV